MSIAGIKPLIAASGWLTALRSISLNPIPDYWRTADLRNTVRAPWYRNGLFLLSLLMSLLATASVIYYIFQVRYIAAGARPAIYIPVSATIATSILAIGATLFALLWVALRLYQLAQVSLGFLELAPRRIYRKSLDDMTAASAMSQQDLLVGLGLYTVRLMLPPLLFVALVQVAVGPLQSVAVSVISGSTHWFTEQFSLEMLQLLGFGIRIVVSGLLASLILTYLLASLGLGEQQGLLPGVGAVVHLIMQTALFAGGIVLLATDLDFSRHLLPIITNLGLGLPLLLILILLLFTARHFDGIRRALAWALPLVLLTTAGLMYARELLIGEYPELVSIINKSMLWSLQGMTIVSPLNLNPMFYGADSLTLGQTAAVDWSHWLLLLVVQAGLLVVTAEFARDAVARRKLITGGRQ